MKPFKLSPKPKSKGTFEEQIKKYLASLPDDELEEFLKEIKIIKKEKNDTSSPKSTMV